MIYSEEKNEVDAIIIDTVKTTDLYGDSIQSLKDKMPNTYRKVKEYAKKNGMKN